MIDDIVQDEHSDAVHVRDPVYVGGYSARALDERLGGGFHRGMEEFGEGIDDEQLGGVQGRLLARGTDVLREEMWTSLGIVGVWTVCMSEGTQKEEERGCASRIIRIVCRWSVMVI